MPNTKYYTKFNAFNPNNNLKIAHFTDEEKDKEKGLKTHPRSHS